MIKAERVNIDARIEVHAEVKLESLISMDEAEKKLEALGNEIVSRDDDRRTFCILDTVNHPIEEVWQCDHCEAYSKDYHVIEAHEAQCHGS